MPETEWKDATAKFAQLSAEIARLRAREERLKEALAKAYISLFMDGRNEHGTHLLPIGGGTSIFDESEVVKSLHPLDGTAEEIFVDAEALGHKVGDCIVTVWEWQQEDGHGYYEYVGIEKLLTATFHGTAVEQASRAALNGEPQ